MSAKYYILNGHQAEPCSTREWAVWFETADRTVKREKVGDGDISTVFLGLDHSFGGTVPMIFETLVFGGKLDGEMERYSTWDEAEKGHAEMCRRVAEGRA